MPEREQVLTVPTILAHEWRQGRRVGRCIHMMVGAEPSEDDILIAVTDDPALSAHIVALHNAALIDGPDGQVTGREAVAADTTAPSMARTTQPASKPRREETRRYRELVRLKDPATMEKRRLAAICPVCGKRLIDGAHR